MANRLTPRQLKIHALVGRRFGALVIKALLPGLKCRVYCEACGEHKTKDKRNIYRLKSCGCQRGKLISIGKMQHGAKTAAGGTAEYVCWLNMKARCYNKCREDYPLYGARGIRVCPSWRKSFVQFLNDIGPKPDPAFSIERREVNGPYTKSNCYWADAHTQRMNQRRMQKSRIKSFRDFEARGAALLKRPQAVQYLNSGKIMATTTITGVKNEVTIVHSNPATPPLATGAGQAVTSSAKNPGQPNGTVHGQVAGTSIIIHNPS